MHRQRVLAAAYAQHPERFVKGRPQPADLPTAVLINPPTKIALFQSRLAHAGYVARPVPAWPDSPSAEALGPV